MDNLSQVPVTMCTMKAAIAAGTTSTLSTTGTTLYCIKGKAYSKSVLANVATPTTDWATGVAFPTLAINKGTVVVCGFDSSGNLKACQGSIEDLDSSGRFIRAPQFPPIPDTMCPFGYIVLKNGATGANFVFGTNNLSAVTGMTYTFVDIMMLPDRPQIA